MAAYDFSGVTQLTLVRSAVVGDIDNSNFTEDQLTSNLLRYVDNLGAGGTDLKSLNLSTLATPTTYGNRAAGDTEFGSSLVEGTFWAGSGGTYGYIPEYDFWVSSGSGSGYLPALLIDGADASLLDSTSTLDTTNITTIRTNRNNGTGIAADCSAYIFYANEQYYALFFNPYGGGQVVEVNANGTFGSITSGIPEYLWQSESQPEGTGKFATIGATRLGDNEWVFVLPTLGNFSGGSGTFTVVTASINASGELVYTNEATLNSDSTDYKYSTATDPIFFLCSHAQVPGAVFLGLLTNDSNTAIVRLEVSGGAWAVTDNIKITFDPETTSGGVPGYCGQWPGSMPLLVCEDIVWDGVYAIDPTELTNNVYVDRDDGDADLVGVSQVGLFGPELNGSNPGRYYLWAEQASGSLADNTFLFFDLDGMVYTGEPLEEGERTPRLPDPAYRLRFGNYTGVLNSLGTFLQTELAKYTDEGTEGVRGGALDLNGKRVRNVTTGVQDFDGVNYGQVKTALGIS